MVVNIFNSVTNMLPKTFKSESNSINLLNYRIFYRSTKSGWMSPRANIIFIHVSNGNFHNIIAEYIQLTIQYITAHINTFLENPTRQAQNKVQMYHCITNSLTSVLQLNIVPEEIKYIIIHTPVGGTLFKCLVYNSSTKTRSTANHLQENRIN